jgi:chromosome segregation ATPase
MAKTEEPKQVDIQAKIDTAVQQARKADLDLIKFIEKERDDLVAKMKADLDKANGTIQDLNTQLGEKLRSISILESDLNSATATIKELRSELQGMQDELKEVG